MTRTPTDVDTAAELLYAAHNDRAPREETPGPHGAPRF
jgi:hypothetical protein